MGVARPAASAADRPSLKKKKRQAHLQASRYAPRIHELLEFITERASIFFASNFRFVRIKILNFSRLSMTNSKDFPRPQDHIDKESKQISHNPDMFRKVFAYKTTRFCDYLFVFKKKKNHSRMQKNFAVEYRTTSIPPNRNCNPFKITRSKELLWSFLPKVICSPDTGAGIRVYSRSTIVKIN